jgi:GNAT superfamily N-acetyltransferase
MLIKYDPTGNNGESQHLATELMTRLSASGDTNLWEDDYHTKPHTLAYLLTESDRFDPPNGEFHIIILDGKIVACGGVYISQFSKEFALAGTRTWVHPGYRHRLLVRELLAEHKKWAIEHGCKAVGVCFNEHNKNLITVFKRIRLGEASDRINQRTPEHMFYAGINEVPFPVTIQNTPQRLIYELLSPKWKFDWQSIQVC